MTPLFIYKSGRSYLVREFGDEVNKLPDDYVLVASIEAREWLQFFLNIDLRAVFEAQQYESKDRKRMAKELEGRRTNENI